MKDKMPYDNKLAENIRAYLLKFPELAVKEQKMFGGLAFMINGKMCVNASGDLLMCRFDPNLTEALSKKIGFLPMIMKGKEYKGYCYVEPTGFKTNQNFKFWINLCLDFNNSAKKIKK
ncbi:MAG: TfoX/Sxy family protein [Sphingobacteriaceae bacterium]